LATSNSDWPSRGFLETKELIAGLRHPVGTIPRGGRPLAVQYVQAVEAEEADMCELE
jgi:hypothetical protein